MRVVLLAALLLLASCSSSESDTSRSGDLATTSDAPAQLEAIARVPLRIPLSLYLVESTDESLFASSARTEEELTAIAAKMNSIWAQADVVFDPVRVATIVVPAELLAGLDQLRPNDLLAGAGRQFEVPEPGLVNGFYVANAGRVNGFAPTNRRVFFVVDEPTVNDERVSSHEVGHILGLHHDLGDSERLLFSGTNGELLTAEEQTVARYFARGFLIEAGLAPAEGGNAEPINGGAVAENADGIEIPNVGDSSLEGHTPRGFAGSGTGLFAGDNLNANFPNNDGVQMFLAFELPSEVPDFERATLVSVEMAVSGDPFDSLGVLQAAPVSFDAFSPAVFDTEPTGTAVPCSVGDDRRLTCDVSVAAAEAVSAGDSFLQLRVRFDEVGDGDGSQDLAMFFLTDSNTNQPGTFRLILE